MFSLIWKALLGGSPLDFVIVGLGAMIALGAAFGAGYAYGTQATVKTAMTVQAAAPAKAAAAQKVADDKDRERGKAAGDAKDRRDAAADHKLNDVLAKIDALSKTMKDCVVPKDAIDLLNEAGQ